MAGEPTHTLTVQSNSTIVIPRIESKDNVIHVMTSGVGKIDMSVPFLEKSN